MNPLPPCPQCHSEYSYEDGAMLVCPECAHEWSAQGGVAASLETAKVWKDANGNVRWDGDHDIDCRIEGFGAMQLKSEFVKKA